ncbi:hypothetical protein L083_2707 [Actinoplanes sp. N902-109]|nr:hypothetical protein L083_2707 [Actinoplanes sp. N902-109]
MSGLCWASLARPASPGVDLERVDTTTGAAAPPGHVAGVIMVAVGRTSPIPVHVAFLTLGPHLR